MVFRGNWSINQRVSVFLNVVHCLRILNRAQTLWRYLCMQLGLLEAICCWPYFHGQSENFAWIWHVMTLAFFLAWLLIMVGCHFLLSVQAVLGLNLNPETDCLSLQKVFVVFLVHPGKWQDSRYLKLGQNCFLPHFFQFSIHCISCHSALYCLSCQGLY